jgi:DNA modification methylase
VLLRRARRSEASRRLAVPFDLHRILVEEAFDFVDDIVWEKPEGAGWATGRGRRFAADRRPLQYKAVPVTEYVLVYRRHTERLLDWNIRAHHDPAAVDRSRIADGYERTNVWRIPPTSRRDHPAVFPVALAERVIRSWSFEDDVVLDPFAGIGTVGVAAAQLGRRFVLSEVEARYVRVMEQELAPWLRTPPPPRTGARRDAAATRS